MSKLNLFRCVCLSAAATVVMLNSGCSQKQLTAQQAREKYGSPYSRPGLLTRTKKQLPPVPIDPALQSSGPAFVPAPSDVQTASHTGD